MVLNGDVVEMLKTLPDESVQCCVTSPPYWGLRDYGMPGQIGLEKTPEEYVAKMVEVFRGVRRVLRSDGVLWLNLGDSYAGSGRGLNGDGTPSDRGDAKQGTNRGTTVGVFGEMETGLKPKDLVGIPWRVAFALQQPFYTGAIKRVEDRVWLAAMIDGEGCMFIHKRKAGTPSYSKFTRADGSEANYERTSDTYGVGLEICNTNKGIIDRVTEIVGGGTFTEQSPEQNNRRKQTIYRWRVAPNDAKRIIREVYPHLVAKQQQARILYACPSNGQGGSDAHQAMMDLHNGKETLIDYPAPPSMFEQGWFLRQDVIWAKKNCMPESVTDRCTKSHEYIFLLTKSARYYYDAEAVSEDSIHFGIDSRSGKGNIRYEGKRTIDTSGANGQQGFATINPTRNRRSVWSITTKPFSGAHFATFPPEIPEICIKAGTSEKGCCSKCGAPWERITKREEPKSRKVEGDTAPGQTKQGGFSKERIDVYPPTETIGWKAACECNADTIPCTVIDPFAGSGTTLEVAERMGRKSIGIELNPKYVKELIEPRLANVSPLFSEA